MEQFPHPTTCGKSFAPGASLTNSRYAMIPGACHYRNMHNMVAPALVTKAKPCGTGTTPKGASQRTANPQGDAWQTTPSLARSAGGSS